MEQPLVTIITPAYNCAKFIKETVDSVLRQDYRNIQYVIIDDGSKDDTFAILTKNYPDKRLTILRQENQGEQKTVNKGLSLVQGKYFIVVNADDPLLPRAISTLAWFMDNHKDVLCAYPDWNMIDENSKFKMHVQTREYDFGWMVRHHTCIPSVGSMFRSSVIQSVGFRDASYRWLGDSDYWLRVGLHGDMCHVPQTLATWRSRSGQASGEKSDLRAKEHLRVMDVVFRGNVPNELRDSEKEAFCWANLVAAYVAESKGMFAGCLWDAFTHYPQIAVSGHSWGTLAQRAKFVLSRSS